MPISHHLDVDRRDPGVAPPPDPIARPLTRREIDPISYEVRRGLLDRDDAAQEAWLVLLAVSQADRLDDRDDVPARFVAVVRNRLADLERRARRRLSVSLARAEADSLVGREEDPAVAYERGRLRAQVRAAFEEARGRLSASSHRILVLRGIEGLTYAEISEALGMAVCRVRDRHRRAIPVVRDLLIRRFGADPAGSFPASLDADAPGPDREGVTR